MRLGNDHTSGTTAGKIAPLSAVADNDYALGMIVEAVSKSRFWPQDRDLRAGRRCAERRRITWIRTARPAFVISPYVKRQVGGQHDVQHGVDAAHDGADAGAASDDAVRRRRAADVAALPGDSGPGALHARRSRASRWTTAIPPPRPRPPRPKRMDFSEADEIDDDELNEILWRAIRGNDPPPPVTAAIFRRDRRDDIELR